MLSKPDDAWPFAMRFLAPEWGLRGIIVAGFLAAVMSTISALANSTATIFSLDVYRRIINKSASDRQLVAVGRGAMAVALITAAMLAPNVERLGGIFNYFQQGVTFLATPFVSVMIVGILWRRANHQGALFGLIGGSIITATLALGLPQLGIHLHWFYVAFIAQVIIITGIVIVSQRTSAPDPIKWKPFLWTPAALSRYDEGKSRPWYQRPLLWYGLFAVIWISIYWRFW